MRNAITMILMLPLLSLVFAADQVNYKDVVIMATLKKVEVNPAVVETITPASEDGKTPAVTKEIEPAYYQMQLDLPFPVYSETVYLNGQDITYSYRNRLDLEGQQVMVLLDVKPQDLGKAKALPGFIGNTWQAIKADPRYVANFKETKADALATYSVDSKTQEITKVPYAEADANELVPMYPGMCGAPVVVEKLSAKEEKPAEELKEEEVEIIKR